MSAESTPQLPLAIGYRVQPTLRNFVSDDPAMLRALESLVRGVEPRMLLFSGSSGTGKSHLLRAAVAAANAAGGTAAYLPLATLARSAAGMVAAQPPCDLISIDEIDQALGEPGLELELFALHNRQLDAGGGLVCAISAPLDGCAFALPDLRSRLAQAIRFVLPSLSDAQRREVFAARCAERGLRVDETALDFLLQRVGRDLPGLMAWVDRLDRESLAAKRRLTVPFVRSLLD